ncbi:MAG: TolC family protein, partial [Clostridia bacterium]|nr:TolC family protein [Clostridia bacterium]
MNYSKEFTYLNQDIRVKTMNLNEKYRAYFPQLNVSYGDNNTVLLNSTDTKDKTLNLGLSQTLYDGDKLKKEIQASKIEIDFMVLDYQQKHVDFIFSLISAYLELRKQEESLLLKKQYLDNQNKELTVTRKKYELGEVTRVDLFEWEIQLRQTEIDVMNLKNQYELARRNLNKQLGLNLETGLNFLDKLNTETVLNTQDYDEENLFQSALMTSQDLKKNYLSINNTLSGSLRRNMFLPDVTVNLSYSTKPDKPFRATDS